MARNFFSHVHFYMQDLTRNKQMDNLVKNGRHYRINTIIVSQKVQRLCTSIFPSCVFIMNESHFPKIKPLYDFHFEVEGD